MLSVYPELCLGYEDADITYKFGDGVTTHCNQVVLLHICGQLVRFHINENDSADSSIPFLLGNDFLDGSVLDLETLVLKRFGITVPIHRKGALYYISLSSAHDAIFYSTSDEVAPELLNKLLDSHTREETTLRIMAS